MVVSRIFDVSSSTGLGIEGYRTCWNRGLSDLLGRWIMKPQPRNESSKYAQTESFGASTSCHCPLLLANGSYALALGRGTKPGHHVVVRPDSWRENLIFGTIRNILHTLMKEPLNIMLLHTGRTRDGPWIKTVPIVSRIFYVSSSTRLGIEGYLTCWKDE